MLPPQLYPPRSRVAHVSCSSAARLAESWKASSKDSSGRGKDDNVQGPVQASSLHHRQPNDYSQWRKHSCRSLSQELHLRRPAPSLYPRSFLSSASLTRASRIDTKASALASMPLSKLSKWRGRCRLPRPGRSHPPNSRLLCGGPLPRSGPRCHTPDARSRRLRAPQGRHPRHKPPRSHEPVGERNGLKQSDPQRKAPMKQKNGGWPLNHHEPKKPRSKKGPEKKGRRRLQRRPCVWRCRKRRSRLRSSGGIQILPKPSQATASVGHPGQIPP